MNTKNGTTLMEKPTRDRRVTIEIIVKETVTRHGLPTRYTGSYTAIMNGQEIATVPFDGGLRKKYEARQALFAAFETIEELH